MFPVIQRTDNATHIVAPSVSNRRRDDSSGVSEKTFVAKNLRTFGGLIASTMVA
jgi:hypothetical protein